MYPLLSLLGATIVFLALAVAGRPGLGGLLAVSVLVAAAVPAARRSHARRAGYGYIRPRPVPLRMRP